MMQNNTQKVFRGTITGWQLHHLSMPQEKLDQLMKEREEEKILPLIITGTVKEDPSGRMEVGWHMRTSPLTFLSEEEGYCETRFSVYRLEGSNGSDIMPDMGDQVLGLFY
ncbi:MAG: hypothetical protein ABW116_13535 [Candidatus Sedimenticola sp. 20ELBAFRAG]